MKAEQLFAVAGLSAVVTGGGNGIGAAYARALADNGATVTLFDRDPDAAEAVAADLRARGGTVGRETVDVTQADDLRAAFRRTADRHGSIDVVFANAGITAGPGFIDRHGRRDPQGALENIDLALWRQVTAVNLTGVFLTIQAAVPFLKQAGGGRIIVTSSVASAKTSPAIGTAYGTTKAGVVHLVRQLAVELARYGITVNSILPGPFMTRITTPELAETFRQGSPMGRAADPWEIEGLALYLSSAASGFVTGASHVIDGGTLLGRPD